MDNQRLLELAGIITEKASLENILRGTKQKLTDLASDTANMLGFLKREYPDEKEAHRLFKEVEDELDRLRKLVHSKM